MTNLPNKIKNLNFVKSLVKVPKYYYFNFSTFSKIKNKILKIIKKNLKKRVIVRSATFSEDGEDSNAGKYLSIPNIKLNNLDILKKAIKQVFSSYGKTKGEEFVLIQEYIQNAESVGVIFTADPRNGSPLEQ